MPAEELQNDTPSRPQSAFGRRHAVLDKNGQTIRGFTTEDAHREFWTDERREEQRQKMLALHAAGKAGGQNGFHRRKVKKAQEILAEKFQEEADKIWERLEAMIDQPKDKRLQLEAIRELARFEDWAVKNSRDDEKELRKLSGNQLDARILEMIGDAMGMDFSAFKEDMQVVVDAEVVELEEPCEACDEERASLFATLRESGIKDEDLIAATAARAHCEDHREAAS